MLKDNLEELFNNIEELNNSEDLAAYAEKIINIETEYLPNNKKEFSNLLIYIKNSLCKALIKKEKELSNNNSKLHLTKLFSKNLYNGLKIDELPLTGHQRTIGSIPKVFLKKNKDKKATALSIYSLFAEYTLNLNYNFKSKDETFKGEEKFLKSYIRQFEKDLTKIVKQKVKLEFIGSGAFGNAFKLSIGNSLFCYKVFFIHHRKDKNITYSHGTLAETEMALYANKNSRRGHFAKFYFGKVGYKYNVDSFIVTEYVDSNKKNESNRYYIDHITSMDANPRNRISDKIVDFGAIKIGIPELEDKKIRKLVRIICNSIYHKFDSTQILYQWNLNKNDLMQLHNYLAKVDKDLYQEALNIIYKYSVGMPLEMRNFYKELKEKKPKESLVYKFALQTKHLFTTNVIELKSNANIFNIIKVETPPVTAFNSSGHFIIELYNDYQAVCFYKETVEKIRIEKQEGNNFRTILELGAGEFKNISCCNVYELLQ